MQWFEPVIAVAAVALVAAPIVTHFVKKKKGTLTCECGKPLSKCVGNCKKCNPGKDVLVDQYRHSSCKNPSSYVYRIHVEGMMCGMCESHINEAVRKQFDDVKVVSSRKKEETLVTSKKVLNVTDLRVCIEATGYKVGSIKLI